MVQFNKYITSFIGFLIIIVIIWNRLLRDRINNTLFFTKTFYILLLVIIIILLLLLLLNTIFQLIKINKNKFFIFMQNNKYYNSITKFILFIKNSPKTFYEIFIFNKFNIAHIVEVPIYFIVKKLAKKPKDFIYIIFNIVPRIIVSIVFLLCVFYFENLIYFYKSLILLCLPLFYSVCLYIIIHLCNNNIKYFREHLKFLEGKKEGFFTVEFAENIPDFPDAIDIIKNKDNTKLLKWFVYNFDIYTNIKNFTVKLEYIEKKYKLYVDIYVYISYIIGWLYILIKLL